MNTIEAKQVLSGLLDAFDNDEHGDYFYDHGWEVCEAVILAMPTIDTVSVSHGRWTENRHDSYDNMREEYVIWYTYTCSECDGEAMCDYRYCPNCGVRMDGE